MSLGRGSRGALMRSPWLVGQPSLFGLLVFVLGQPPAGSPAGRRFRESSRPAGAAVGCCRRRRASAGQLWPRACRFVFGCRTRQEARDAQGRLAAGATGPGTFDSRSDGLQKLELVPLASEGTFSRRARAAERLAHGQRSSPVVYIIFRLWLLHARRASTIRVSFRGRGARLAPLAGSPQYSL